MLHPHMTSIHVRNALASEEGRHTTLTLAYAEISRAIHLAYVRGGMARGDMVELCAYAADGTYAALKQHTAFDEYYHLPFDVSSEAYKQYENTYHEYRATAWAHLNTLCTHIGRLREWFKDTLCVPGITQADEANFATPAERADLEAFITEHERKHDELRVEEINRAETLRDAQEAAKSARKHIEDAMNALAEYYNTPEPKVTPEDRAEHAKASMINMRENMQVGLRGLFVKTRALRTVRGWAEPRFNSGE